MGNWYDMHAMQMSNVISEDVGAPELRNPRAAAMRPGRANWFLRLIFGR